MITDKAGNEFNNEEEQAAWDFVQKLARLDDGQKNKLQSVMLINPAQYRKLEAAERCLNLLKDEFGGEVNLLTIQPGQKEGLIEAKLPMLDLVKEQVQQFTQMLEGVDVLSIEPTTDNYIRIGINVNDVFRPIK